ncbi:MAG: aminotransferase class V-fold PLP-dependent enzyme [Actinomycetota bacterium]|nr:aminotransferase class V-fold PLP-dependent enzyme [Actinomycetota bacterium]
MFLTTRRQFVSLLGASALGARSGGGEPQPQPGSLGAFGQEFPALRQQVNGQPLVYLDSAATTLRPQAVIDALVDYYSTDNANPSPVHTLAAKAAARLSAAREAAAHFVNAASQSEIIFVRGTTEGMNLVASTWGAKHLSAGDDVVLSVAEHASNLLPWMRAAERAGARVRVADVDGDGRAHR